MFPIKIVAAETIHKVEDQTDSRPLKDVINSFKKAAKATVLTTVDM